MSEAAPTEGSVATLVLVPTTGGALRIERLAPRPGLPRGAAFAAGDYRPLALSADYGRLSAPEGPLAKALTDRGGLPPHTLPPHELRLSASPDGGRSWEAPVALAHLLLAHGHRIVADPAEAELVVWATGAVDLDLRILPGDYALPLKVAASAAVLEAAATARIVAVLPPGPDRAAAAEALRALRADVEIVRADALSEAAARIVRPAFDPASTEPIDDAGTRRRGAFLPLAAASMVLAGGGLWYASAPSDPDPMDAPPATVAVTTDPVRPITDEDGPAPGSPLPDNVPTTVDDAPATADADDGVLPVRDADGRTVTGDDTAPFDRVEADPPLDPSPNPPLRIETVHAAPGATCARALFDPAQRVRRPVIVTAGTPEDGELTPDLCGIALTAAPGVVPGELTSDPPDAFVGGGADPAGGRVLFLRGTPRDTLYTVPFTLGDGTQAFSRHALRIPDTTERP